MNVLLLSGELGSGGAPRVCYQVARHLPDDINITVAYLGGRNGLVEKFEQKGIPVKRLAENPVSLTAAKSLNQHLKEQDYDLIHTHMLSAGLIGRPIAKLNGIPVVHTIHTNYEMRPRKAKIPDLLSAPFGDLAVCVSDSVEQSLPSYYISEIEVIYNCIDIDVVREKGDVPWDELGWTTDLDPSAPIVANVARYDPKKRRIDLIEGFKHVLAECSDAQLVLTGRRSHRQQQLSKQAQELGIAENIYFVGFVENPQSVYQHADVIALPSEAEGFSIGMLEAMAHERPIVASEIPAFVDALGKEYPAYIPVRDPEKLGECLIDLLTDSDVVHESIEIISNRIDDFSGSKAAEQYFDVYKSTIEDNA